MPIASSYIVCRWHLSQLRLSLHQFINTLAVAKVFVKERCEILLAIDASPRLCLMKGKRKRQENQTETIVTDRERHGRPKKRKTVGCNHTQEIYMQCIGDADAIHFITGMLKLVRGIRG